MKISVFANNAVISAKNYLQIAQNAKLALDIVSITEIKSGETANEYEITLSEHLKFPDSVYVRLTLPGIPSNFFINKKLLLLNPFHAHLADYDNVNKTAKICVSADFNNHIAGVKKLEQYISVASDLQFLIENVKKWYSNHGLLINIPPEPEIQERFFLEQASDEQNRAVETVLSNNISYIWGAPGTGKTRVVLASAILTYIKNKQRVLLIAPTNNAVENTLRAVIGEMRKLGEDISCLLRLGTPSKDFAIEFSEICIKLDIKQLIEDINSRLSNAKEELNKVKEHNRFLSMLSTAEEKTKKYLFSEERHKELKRRLNELSEKIIVCDNAVVHFSKEETDAQSKLLILNRKKNAFLAKFRSAKFKDELKAEISEQYQKHLYAINSKNEYIRQRNETLCLKGQAEEELKAVRVDLEQSGKLLRDVSIELFCTELEPNSLLSEIYKKIASTVTAKTEEELEEEIKKLEDALADKQKEITAMIHEKFVYALTVDHFYSAYDDLNEYAILGPELKHIFVDEAAYVPLIKAGILFSCGVPVALFGDHKQLPPVCPLDDQLLKDKTNGLFLWSQSSLFFPQIFSKQVDCDVLFNQFDSGSDLQFTNMEYIFLSKTFRFGDNLASIMNDCVYKKNLHGKSEDTKITIIDAPHTDFEINMSSDEAKAVLDYLIVNKPSECAILTPFNNQRILISEKIKKCEKVKDYDVLTVHRSQGLEWDTVIMSVVWNGPRDFITDMLVNTAVSRAKKDFVLVCDVNQWIANGRQSFISSLIKKDK